MCATEIAARADDDRDATFENDQDVRLSIIQEWSVSWRSRRARFGTLPTALRGEIVDPLGAGQPLRPAGTGIGRGDKIVHRDPELTADYAERISVLGLRYPFGGAGGMGMALFTFVVLLAPTAHYPNGQLNPPPLDQPPDIKVTASDGRRARNPRLL